MRILTTQYTLLNTNTKGELAQLARAPALHAGGHRFDSDILHELSEKDNKEFFDILKEKKHKRRQQQLF